MKCAVHAEVDATGYCRNCGKALCPACTREVKGVLYCEECLASAVGKGPQAEAGASGHAVLAATLGWIPGLGAVINGEYIKALIHVLIFGGMIAILSGDFSGGFKAMVGVLLGAFVCFMPIDAYRVAKAKASGEPLPGLSVTSGRYPTGAVVLIALGVLFLLSNLGLLNEEWFDRGWPLLLIGLGIWLIWRRTQRSN